MRVTLYGIKNCDTVKKARSFLAHAGVEVDFVDFKITAPSIDTVRAWSNRVGIETLFNRKSKTYKELALATQPLDEEKILHLLTTYPLLIKRPVVVYNDTVIVGFNDTSYQGLLPNE